MRVFKFLLILVAVLALLVGGFLFTLKRADLSQYRVLLQNFVAAETGRAGTRIHQSFDYGNIGMSMFAFGGQGLF